MKDIYSLAPVNKTASIVTSQKNVTVGLSEDQKRANYVAQWKILVERIKALPPKSTDRKRLNAQRQEIEGKISAIRPKRKSPGIHNYIIDILKERMTSNQWAQVTEEARKRQDKDKAEGKFDVSETVEPAPNMEGE